MNRRLKQLFTSVMIAAMLAVVIPYQSLVAFAASGQISFSDKSASVGEEVSIKMKITAKDGTMNSADVMLSYDPGALEFLSGTNASGGVGKIRVKISADTASVREFTSTLKFKTIKAGTTKITVGSQEIYDGDGQAVTIDKQGDSTLTVKALAGASKDASLSGLQVLPGTLTPEFSPEVDRYTVTVGTDVEKITVSAPALDGKANVVVTGAEDLQMGENQVVCKVTAEDGTTEKIYTIVVTKAEGGDSSTSIPAEGVDVITAAKTVTIIPLEEGVEIPEGFAESELEIDGVKANGWVWAGDSDYQYCIFYGVNEKGEKGFYRYDLKERTMQRYFRDVAGESDISQEQYVEVAEQYNALTRDYKIRLYIIIGLGVLSVILMIVSIMLFMSGRRKQYENLHDRDSRNRFGDERAAAREDILTRRKTSHHTSKEERYLLGLEEEESAQIQKANEKLAREAKQQAVKRRTQTVQTPEDDDDFEFIDLDL